MYPQRHGTCSLSFWQQMLDGFEPYWIGSKHELNSTGLHVVSASAATGTKSVVALLMKMMNTSTNTDTPLRVDNFIFFFEFSRSISRIREMEKL